jgi:hypothetical protein
MARRPGAVTAGEQGEAVLQSPRHLLCGKGSHPRRRQLDRQRDAVQPAADLRDRRPAFGGQHELRSRLARALGEELHGVTLSHGRDAQHHLAGDSQRLPARRQDPQPGTVGQERRYQAGAGVVEVLAVVDYQQALPRTKEIPQRLFQ